MILVEGGPRLMCSSWPGAQFASKREGSKSDASLLIGLNGVSCE